MIRCCVGSSCSVIFRSLINIGFLKIQQTFNCNLSGFWVQFEQLADSLGSMITERISYLRILPFVRINGVNLHHQGIFRCVFYHVSSVYILTKYRRIVIRVKYSDYSLSCARSMWYSTINGC
uniref:Uncharacterized protein n=1 Tax=Callorhinchus milii TaxID=7868 RepID=A0A4W3JFY3_CALMI